MWAGDWTILGRCVLEGGVAQYDGQWAGTSDHLIWRRIEELDRLKKLMIVRVLNRPSADSDLNT